MIEKIDGKKGNASVKTKSLELFKKDVGYFLSVFWYPLPHIGSFHPYQSVLFDQFLTPLECWHLLLFLDGPFDFSGLDYF